MAVAIQNVALQITRGSAIENYPIVFAPSATNPGAAPLDMTGIVVTLTVDDPAGEVSLPVIRRGNVMFLNVPTVITDDLTAGVHDLVVEVRDTVDGNIKIQTMQVEVL